MSEPLLSAIGPTCNAKDVTMRSGTFGAGAGSAAEILVLTDAGPRRCTLRGTPEVHFLDQRGQVVPLAVLDQTGGLGFFPAVPNSGVGLIPLANDGATGTAGRWGRPVSRLSGPMACAPYPHQSPGSQSSFQPAR
jgi:hypothetical protein